MAREGGSAVGAVRRDLMVSVGWGSIPVYWAMKITVNLRIWFRRWWTLLSLQCLECIEHKCM